MCHTFPRSQMALAREEPVWHIGCEVFITTLVRSSKGDQFVPHLCRARQGHEHQVFPEHR